MRNLDVILGALLPAWRYHLEAGFTEAGNYFLSLAVGFLLSTGISSVLLARKGPKFVLVLANALACGGFLILAFAMPPALVTLRLMGTLWIGVGAGLLNTAMFQATSPLYQRARAATTNLAGVLFGLGCLLTALLVAGTYYVYNGYQHPDSAGSDSRILGGSVCAVQVVAHHRGGVLDSRWFWHDFKNPGAVLFGLLLFFQFGNEWSIAGW